MSRARKVRRLRRRPEEIERIVQAYEASGLSQRAFAQSIGLSPQSLRNWICKRQGRPRETRSTIVPVRIVETQATSTPFEVVLSGRRVVRVAPDFDADALKKLVSALESPC
jgi:transposase-like protein